MSRNFCGYAEIEIKPKKNHLNFKNILNGLGADIFVCMLRMNFSVL